MVKDKGSLIVEVNSDDAKRKNRPDLFLEKEKDESWLKFGLNFKKNLSTKSVSVDSGASNIKLFNKYLQITGFDEKVKDIEISRISRLFVVCPYLVESEGTIYQFFYFYDESSGVILLKAANVRKLIDGFNKINMEVEIEKKLFGGKLKLI